MLRSAREIPNGTVVDSGLDLCIIGAGAAGITLANAFSGGRESVLLLESGGFGDDPLTQSLYEGPAEGTIFEAGDTYLSRSRLRYFGGSTNHWEGLCRALDPHDFLERNWVPYSGWPIGASDLAPYYEDAAALCELEGFHSEPSFDVGVPGLRGVSLHLSPPTRFGARYRQALESSENVTVMLFANAVELAADADASRVESVQVRTLEGNAFSVRARSFVLACGGVENPRLLLASNGTQAEGLGNGNDLVGRFFMEHPHVAAGALCFVRGDAESLEALLGTSLQTLGALGLDPDLQARHELLNGSIEPRRITRQRNIDAFMRDVGTLAAHVGGPPGESSEPIYANLLFRAEQAPSPESRVRLDDVNDALGRRRARLDWRLSDDDRTSIERSLELMARVLGEAGRARVRIEPVLETSWPRTYPGAHHMGTTRMHDDPERGVVDANGRMHTVENLYVAGSSVFPTSGFANPTLTIVALTLRLAEHLKREIGGA